MANYHVNIATGTDSTSGGRDGSDASASKVWKTIQFAMHTASGEGPHTIYVAEGSYPEAPETMLYLSDGTEGNLYTNVKGKTITVTPETTNTSPVTVTTTYTGSCIYVRTKCTTGTFVFDGINFAPNTAGNVLTNGLVYCVAAQPNITIKNSIITIPASAAYGLVRADTAASATRNITFENCVVTGNGKVRNLITDCGTFTMKNCQLTNTDDTYPVFQFTCSTGLGITKIDLDTVTVTGGTGNRVNFTDSGGGVGIVSIKNCDFNGADGYGVYFPESEMPITQVTIENNTIVSGKGCINVPMNAVQCLIDNNKLTATHATSTTPVIQVGVDGGTNNYPLGNVIVTNNTCTFGGVAISHCMLIGRGCNNAEVSGNRLSLGDIQLVIKSDGVNVHHNTTNGPRGIYIKGSYYSRITNNTVYATSGSPFEFGAGETHVIGNYAYVMNNIFSGSGNSYALADVHSTWMANIDYLINVIAVPTTPNGYWYYVSIDGGTSGASEPFWGITPGGTTVDNGLTWTCVAYDDKNIFDYNCYVSGSLGFSKLGGTVLSDFTALKAKWLTWNTLHPLNDEHSIVANPALDSNYQARNSALKEKGTISLYKTNGDVVLYNDIGATKFEGGTDIGNFGGNNY